MSDNDRSPYQSPGSFPCFLHLAVRSFPESFQELVPVLQVVFVVVPLHGLPLHGHLCRGFAHRWVRRQSADTQALHPEALALLGGAGDREHAHSSAVGRKKKPVEQLALTRTCNKTQFGEVPPSHSERVRKNAGRSGS